MWWEKKTRLSAPKEPIPTLAAPRPPTLDEPMKDNMPTASTSLTPAQNQTVLGRSVVLRGELSANEDLLIEGQFEGTISLQDHCLTVGAQGEIKAEVHARQVVIRGSVHGNISAREKIEICKTGHVVGDLLAAAIAIEEGAYFKGSIDVLRETAQEVPRAVSAPSALETSA